MGMDFTGDGIGDDMIPHATLDWYPYTTKSGWLPPDPPVLTDPGIYDSDGSYLLKWSAVIRGYKYSVMEDTVMDFGKSPTEIYNGTSTSFLVKNRVNRTYYYKVRAINTTYKKISGWSNVVNMIVDWPPDIPQNFLVSVYPEGNTLNLSWDLNSIDTKAYKIEYKTDLTDWTNLTTVDSPNNKHNHTGLIDGKKYYYRICAFDARDQVSGYSEEVDGIPHDSMPPAKPKGLTVQEIGIGFINISWSPNTDPDLAGYSIYRESWARAMFLDITQHTWYLDTSVEDDKSYYYNLTAFDEVPNHSPTTPPLGPITIPKAPSIIQTDPTAGAVDVPIEAKITVTFSKSMNVASVESSFIISPEVDGIFEWSEQNKTFVYTPSTILTYSTFYTLGIGTGAKDLHGYSLLSLFEWNFTTIDDLIRPTVISHSPTGTDVPITTKIRITFSEAMTHETVEAVFEITPYTTGTMTWESNILTFTPSEYLLYNTTYQVNLGGGAEDLAGNSLSAAYTWNFTTEAQEASIPKVIAYSPQGNNVPIDADVTVEFIKPMNQSATKNAFSITPAIEGILTWYENALIFTHTTKLDYKTTYNVTISTSAEDLWGNHLPADFSWEFTTETKIIQELPKILVLQPLPGDEVEIDTEIMVKFSKAISYPPAHLGVRDASDSTWVGNLTYDNNNNMLKFEPSTGEYLSYGTIYTVTLSGVELDIGEFNINAVEVRGYLYSWTFKTKPQDGADTDQDGMDDKWEEDFKLNPFDETDAHDDLDEDGLKNIDEYRKGTEPDNKDTDGDGLNDFVEINEYQTDPLKIDSDDDTYPDGDEVDAGTDPLNPDDNPGITEDVTGDKGFGTYLLYFILAIVIIIIILLLVFSKLRRREPEGEPEAQKEIEAEEEDLEDWQVTEEDDEAAEEPEETEEEPSEDEEEAEAPEPHALEAEELPSMEELGGGLEIDEDIFDDTELAVTVKKPKKGEVKKKAKEPKKVKEKAKKKAKEEKPTGKKGTKAKARGAIKPKKKGEKTEPDKPNLHTMEKIVKCNICFGNIKTGLNIITCSCGKHYHENCAKRVGNCPVCETSLKEPVDMTGQDEE
jgi:fibronectin type 3 domain-containing protein